MKRWSLFVVVGGVLALGPGCGKWADDLACGDQGCGFTREEWRRIESMALVCTAAEVTAGLPCGRLPDDPSNKYLPFVPETGRLNADAVKDPFVLLGRALYHDKRLSGTASGVDVLGLSGFPGRAAVDKPVNISCASCHDPVQFGSDFTSHPRAVSIGAGWYDVNAQQTLNIARQPVFYWNGRTDTVWAQAAQVMESAVSMNGHRMKTFWVINEHYPQYASLFADVPNDHVRQVAELAAALGPAPDPETTTKKAYKDLYDLLSPDAQRTVTLVHVNVAKAIAAYEWLLFSDDSAFDRFVKEGPSSSELSAAAQRGLKVFVGRGSCVDCHNGPLLSDGAFHNIGIPQVGNAVPTVAACSDPAVAKSCDCVSEKSCLPWGAFAGVMKRPGQEFQRRSVFSDNEADRPMPGAAPAPAPSLEEDPELSRLIYAWRTPSLRDVAMTGPYMHDGLFNALDDVVWHYDQAAGGGSGSTAAEERSGRSELSALNLSAAERADLVAFLSSLTGRRFSPLSASPDAADSSTLSAAGSAAGAAPGPTEEAR